MHKVILVGEILIGAIAVYLCSDILILFGQYFVGALVLILSGMAIIMAIAGLLGRCIPSNHLIHKLVSRKCG